MQIKTINDSSKLENDNYYPTAMSITRDEMLALYDRRYEELSKKSKDELIKMLIGEKPYYLF